MGSILEMQQRAGWLRSQLGNVHEATADAEDHLTKLEESIAAFGAPEEPTPPEEPPIEEPDPDPENETPEIPDPETPGLLVADDFSSYADGDPLSGSVGPPDSPFRWIGSTPNTLVSTRYAFSGDRSMLFPFPATPPDKDSIREQRFTIVPTVEEAPSEVGVEFMLRVPNNWWFRDAPGAGNSKLLAIWAESYTDGPYTEPKFVFEMGWGGGGDGDANLWYVMNERGPSGGRLEPRKGGRQNQLVVGTAIDTSMRGQWIRLRFHLKIGMAGIADVWRDDELVCRIPSDWRTLPQFGVKNYLRNGYMIGWSNAGYDEDTDFAVDNFIMHRGTPPWLAEMAA